MHAEQTAQAIVDLINSRPQSPRVEEIAAIIGRASLGDVLDGNEDLARWRRSSTLGSTLTLHTSKTIIRGTPRRPTHTTRLRGDPCGMGEARAFLRRCDFVVAGYWNTTGHLDYLPYPDDVMARADGFDEVGLAYLMRGLMDLTPVEFNVDGRLRKR